MKAPSLMSQASKMKSTTRSLLITPTVVITSTKLPQAHIDLAKDSAKFQLQIKKLNQNSIQIRT